MKRILSALIVLMLCLQFVFAFADAPLLITAKPSETKVFSDVKEGDWFYADVINAYNLKLINGKGTGTFKPDDNMTYAEAVKLAACMNELHTTGAVTLENGNPWYQSYVDYCKEKEIITKDYDYNATVTRAGYMEIFANALDSEALKKINSVPDNTIPDVPSSEAYAPAVYKLYRAGILAGVDEEHNCSPMSNIKRSEVAVILSRMMDATKRITFTTGDDDSILTYAIFSDVHNSKDPFNTIMRNIMTLSNDGKDLDGLLLVGDIVYFQAEDKPDPSFYSMINSNEDFVRIKNEGKLVFNMGNHEFPINDNTEETTKACRDLFTQETGELPETHKVLGGYHFITAGPANYAGGLNAEQEKYVMTEVGKALKDGNDKPVFVLLHHPVGGTLYGVSSGRYHSIEFEKFLKAEPRLIVISAHMHYPLSDPRSIYQVPGGATFIYSSTVMGGNGLSNPYATERHSTYPKQAYMMKINSNTNVVTLKRFYMHNSKPEYLEGGDWVLDIPAMVKDSMKPIHDTENVYKYTYDERKAKSVMPYFKDTDEITFTKLTEKRAIISYPVATVGGAGEDNFVGYYKIEFYNKATKETVTHKVISDYFLQSKPERREYTFSNLTPGTEYTVTITPLNMWFIEGTKKLTVSFTTPLPEYPEVELVDTRDYDVFEAELTVKYYTNEDHMRIDPGRGGTILFPISVNEPGTYRILLLASGTDAELRMSLNEVEYEQKVLDGVEEDVIVKETELIKDKKILINTDSINVFEEIPCYEFKAEKAGDYVIKFKKNKTNSHIGLRCVIVGRHK